MQINSPILFIEINNFEFIFKVVDSDDNNRKCKLIYSNRIPSQGLSNNKIINYDLLPNFIKKNIFSIEQSLKYVFKEVNLIIDNFECSLISFTGYKRLNGSQLTKENITYIINSLRSEINMIEQNKTVIHIFNSKFLLDNLEIDNIPVGLFGNFYSHELSFFLIDKNDHKNLISVFEECNLRVKKIISKKFLDGVNLIKREPNIKKFLKISINKDNSNVIFFENSSLKFIQNFNFGSNLIINDISKVISLDKGIILDILLNSENLKKNSENMLIEEKYFQNINYRKIKTALMTDIALARIKEFFEIILLKNININYLLYKKMKIFMHIEDKTIKENFFKNLDTTFFKARDFDMEIVEDLDLDKKVENIYNFVQYGWNKEAVPITQKNKTIISRFFDLLFK